MGRAFKNMALAFLFLLVGDMLCAANKVPNIQIFKQPPQQLVYPVLLVEFEDVKFSVADPKKQFNELFNAAGYTHNGAVGSVSEYFNANFSGRASFRFEVSEVLTLGNPVAVYGAPSAASNDADVLQMVKDALVEALACGMDFSVYDNDDDGYVDNLTVVFAGYSESEGGPAESIWPHQLALGEEDVAVGEVKIASYTCNSELAGADGAYIAPIGHICHEFSHFLGLADLYDVNGEQEGISPALYGSLSIMDRGHFLNNGNSPPYFNALEREMLGLCSVEELEPDRTYTFGPVCNEETVYRINTSNSGEYFLLECRTAKGWDAHIGGEGLVVYHIDKSRKVYGGLPSADRWKYNNLNCYAPHECVRVMSAAGAAESVGKVFFPGTERVTELVSSGGKMPLLEWGGHPVGIGIVDIRFAGGKVTFRTVSDYRFDSSLPRAMECSAVPYQNEIRVEWSMPASGYDGTDEIGWLVEWRIKGEAKSSSMQTNSSFCYLEGIEPGKDYEIQIKALKGNSYGEASYLKTRSIPVTAGYPYIHICPDGYKVGDVMDLRVMNLVEEYISVEWQVNGSLYKGKSIVLEHEGLYNIIAVIKYTDGSYEKLYKNIEVR